MQNKLKIILVSILSIIVVLVLYINKNINLEMLKNTSLEDTDKINVILKNLKYNKELSDFEIVDDAININYDIESYDYKSLEKNATILFYLIDDLKNVKYQIEDETYLFSYDKINLIYDNFQNIKIKDINKRYDSKNFKYNYLGNIKGNIDLFDTSDLCITEYQEIYHDTKYVYYMTCSSVDEVIVTVDDDEYKLNEALEQNIITIDELFDINVKMKKESLDKNENIN